jgi:hypothetical protein
MKNTILSFILVGLHTNFASGLPQQVLASASKPLPQQQISIRIGITQSPFPFRVLSTATCITEDYGCEQSYCWRKVSLALASLRNNLVSRVANTCASALMLEIGAGGEMRWAIPPGVRLSRIALKMPLLVR